MDAPKKKKQIKESKNLQMLKRHFCSKRDSDYYLVTPWKIHVQVSFAPIF
jgi:hypothetical protein